MKSNEILNNKRFGIPSEVLKGLEVSLNTFKGSEDKAGLKRAQTLMDEKTISFKEMERLKNFFENYDGENEQEYRLSGGGLMKDFVINGVAKLRKALDRVKRERMKAGEKNQFKSTHEKDKYNADPTRIGGLAKVTSDGEHSQTSDQITNNRTAYYESYVKEIENIRYLIEYMDNNNKIL